MKEPAKRMASRRDRSQPHEVRTLLRHLQLFSGLDDDSLDSLVPLATQRDYPRGAMLFVEGSVPPGVLALRSGAVRVFRTSPGGKVHLLHLARAGETVAEVAVVGGFPCPASAEAAEDTSCILLPREPFLAAMESDGTLALAVMRGLARRVRYMVNLLEDVVLRDAVGRLASHLLKYEEDGAELELVMLKKDLASHLALTSETLSRSLRRLDDDGVIELVGLHGVRILDRSSLRRLAEGEAAGDERPG